MNTDGLLPDMGLEEYLEWYAAQTKKPPVRAGSSSSRKGTKGAGEERDWGQELINQVAVYGLPAPVREYKFHAKRRWKLDLAWKEKRVACEIEGGIWMQTKTGRGKGHAHPVRFEQDIEKYNELELRQWTLIRVTPKMIEDGRALDWLERALL